VSLATDLSSATGHGRTGVTPTTRWDVAAFTVAVGPGLAGRFWHLLNLYAREHFRKGVRARGTNVSSQMMKIVSARP
jgi:hypothetical protein